MRDLVLETARGQIAGLAGRNPGASCLLAVHGWLDNAASFVPMAPFLGRYDLVSIDLPGHGRSFHYNVDEEYCLTSTLLDVLMVADTLGWSRFSILGHSLGGAAACLLAAAAPERIEGLYLIDALGPLAGRERSTADRLREAVNRRRAPNRNGKRIFADFSLALRARMQSAIVGLDEEPARLLVDRGLRAVAGGFEWSSDPRLTLPTLVRMTEGQIQDCLRAIVCPVHLVVATPEPAFFTAEVRDARLACVRQMESASLPGSHYIHMTHPDAVVAALKLNDD